MATVTIHRRDLGKLATLFVIAWFIAPISNVRAQETGESSLSPELEAVRTSLEKYQDPIVAVHDGYFSTVGCIEIMNPGGPGRAPYKPGGMGVHFLNMSAVGPAPDPKTPSVLIYEPDGDQLRLVAAEWFIPLATGVKERPQLFGQPFDGPMEGHHPLMPAELHHYDLHVWLFKPNPLGMFAPTNPAVKCSGQAFFMPEEAPPLVEHKVAE